MPVTPSRQVPDDGRSLALRASLLHPSVSPRLPGGEEPTPTLYVRNRLLVSGAPVGGDVEAQLDPLRAALAELGLQARVPADVARRRERLSRGGRRLQELLDAVSAYPVVLEAVGDGPAPPPDAWVVLQRLRITAPEVAATLSLDHIVRSADGYWGGVDGYWGGVDGFWGGVGARWDGTGPRGMAEYGTPGRGGRMPVTLGLPDPSTRARVLARHPVVALPDTGIGRHPWFDDHPRVLRDVAYAGQLIGGPDADLAGTRPDALTGQVGRDVGHGTFVAGLVRQGCPEASLLTVPVLTGTGVAEEADILDALTALLLRHVEGQQAADPAGRDQVIDVLSLSIGYYPESVADVPTSPLARLLRRFGEEGVLVVAAVGNDATPAPFVPAALAGRTGRDALPVVGVGALNPDGSTVALFCNAGPHVSTHRPGVAIVSTVPTADAGLQPSTVAGLDDGLRRTTLDPDNYAGGFAIWSGTSFAAPVLAAELAARLAEADDLEDVSAQAMRARGWDALRACVGWSPA